MSDECISMPPLKPEGVHYFVHGANMRNKRLYGVWKTMMHRCYNPKREKYKDYGGRGISVCNEWHDPNAFMDWAEANGYADGLQLDRVNNDGNYAPDNCRFATPKENSRNRRNAKHLTINGETRLVVEWCEDLNISTYTVYWWMRTHGREYAEKRVSEAWNRRAGESNE